MIASDLLFARQGLSMNGKNDNYSKLVNEIDNLIHDKATFSDGYELSLDKLEEDELSQLAYLCIENDNRENVSECFLDPSQDEVNDDVTCALISLLKNNSKENKETLTDLIIQRSINCYKDFIQELIDKRCEDLTEDYMDEHGFKAVMDDQTGCYEWRRYG